MNGQGQPGNTREKLKEDEKSGFGENPTARKKSVIFENAKFFEKNCWTKSFLKGYW